MTAEVSRQSGLSSGLVSITATLGEPGDAEPSAPRDALQWSIARPARMGSGGGERAQRADCQPAARAPSTPLSEAMIAPPTVTARNDRAKLVWKNVCRSQARASSSTATTLIAAVIAAP
jgi:hypothetical protein